MNNTAYYVLWMQQMQRLRKQQEEAKQKAEAEAQQQAEAVNTQESVTEPAQPEPTVVENDNSLPVEPSGSNSGTTEEVHSTPIVEEVPVIVYTPDDTENAAPIVGNSVTTTTIKSTDCDSLYTMGSGDYFGCVYAREQAKQSNAMMAILFLLCIGIGVLVAFLIYHYVDRSVNDGPNGGYRIG